MFGIMVRSVFLCFVLMSVYAVCEAQQVNTVSPTEFHKHMKAEKGYLLDVRTDWEFESGYLEGAVNADIHGDKFRVLADKLDHAVPCYVYCFSGGRSHEAATYLVSKGFKKVYEMQGGIAAWQKAGLPIVK